MAKPGSTTPATSFFKPHLLERCLNFLRQFGHDEIVAMADAIVQFRFRQCGEVLDAHPHALGEIQSLVDAADFSEFGKLVRVHLKMTSLIVSPSSEIMKKRFLHDLEDQAAPMADDFGLQQGEGGRLEPFEAQSLETLLLLLELGGGYVLPVGDEKTRDLVDFSNAKSGHRLF